MLCAALFFRKGGYVLLRYTIKRLVGLILVLFGVTILSFVIANISAVEPAEAYVKMNSMVPTEENLEKAREELGLDKPILEQYTDWLKGAVHLDFGTSYASKGDVGQELMSRFPSTLYLVSVSIAIVALMTVLLGVLSALYKGRWPDKLIHAVTLVGASTPIFWLGYILVLLFAITFSLVPVTGYGDWNTVLLPAITLAVPMIGTNTRVLRANILENMNQDYVLYAQARGLSRRRIIGKHILKNAAAPMLTILAQTFGSAVASSMLIEAVFSWPGIGNYAVSAILNRDLPVINAYVVVMAVVFVICNLLADLIQMKFNPKLLTEGGDI